ncbi:hypothetical protein WJX74_007835 [Apatococcus lobatus]|uniref:Lipoxygenase domain-containing protein n=1 Tax=Apatococcus lobatus TaxID=904363 RepID=A0AAW1QVY3_9CHLO
MTFQPGSALQRRSGTAPSPWLCRKLSSKSPSCLGPDHFHRSPSSQGQRGPLLVRASTLEAQRPSSLAERLKGFASQKRDSARYLAVDIVLQNPDKTLEFNRGAIHLIDEDGNESRPESFYKVNSSLNLGGKLSLLSKVTGSNADPDKLEASVLKLDHEVPKNFGKTAAIRIRADAFREDVRFWLLKVSVKDDASRMDQEFEALAQSWVHCKQDWRLFWVNKFYLPADTPPALQSLREQELQGLRNDDGQERCPWDRIYNYAVYNDLGTPEKPRPTLKPYPTREATNRPLNEDMSEGPSGLKKSSWVPMIPLPKVPGLKTSPSFFIPFDEEFSPVKGTTFKKNGLLYAIPILVDKLLDKFRTGEKIEGFESLLDINRFYEADFWDQLTGWLPDAFKFLAPVPGIVAGRVNEWETDEEVGRQTLAGQNPCMLQALKAIPEDSIITAEHLQPWVENNNLQDLLESGKRLFQVDYTALKAFLADANTQFEDGERLFYMYATRGIFYLTNNGYMTLIAIEMIDCPDANKPDSTVSKVVLPRGSGPQNMDKQYWRLAKAYFASNDSGYHQLVSHWLRTHACTEPYIIATRRQLSAAHPVYGLLHPHFKYTMPINRNARQKLINAGGVIESSFSPGAHCLRVCSAIYGLDWRFDKEALPADLIHRGMAVEDPNGSIAWKGKKYASILADYPYADDGMLIWNALHGFCSDYLQVYYPNDQAATMLLSTLVNIPTVPTCPTIPQPHTSPCQTLAIPRCGKNFKENPDGAFLDTVSSRAVALKIMLIVQLLSTHDPDEEYLGDRTDGWTSDAGALEVFKKYKQAVSDIDKQVDARNKNVEFKSRFPNYTTLQPHTTPEDVANIRARGVPNSISI